MKALLIVNVTARVDGYMPKYTKLVMPLNSKPKRANKKCTKPTNSFSLTAKIYY